MRARLGGLYGLFTTSRYLRVHCCTNVTHTALTMLMARLLNHSVFTRTAEAVGLKEGWLGRVKDADVSVPFDRVDNCWEI
jgi:hypothetical protein